MRDTEGDRETEGERGGRVRRMRVLCRVVTGGKTVYDPSPRLWPNRHRYGKRGRRGGDGRERN